jgi:hypothetical protein
MPQHHVDVESVESKQLHGLFRDTFLVFFDMIGDMLTQSSLLIDIDDINMVGVKIYQLRVESDESKQLHDLLHDTFLVFFDMAGDMRTQSSLLIDIDVITLTVYCYYSQAMYFNVDDHNINQTHSKEISILNGKLILLLYPIGVPVNKQRIVNIFLPYFHMHQICDIFPEFYQLSS